jgi:hypothetical protein
MDHFAGLDASVKETSICIVDVHGEECGHVTHEERMFARKTRAEA